MQEVPNPIATIHMASGAKIVVELCPAQAPNSVNCFIDCIRKGFYTNREIQRIVPGFIIQPTYDAFGMPESDFEIFGEFFANNFPNNLRNEEMTVAISGDGKTYSCGIEFYFILGYHEKLQGRYGGIGRVIEGWEEVKRIENVALKSVIPPSHWPEDAVIQMPVEPEIIKSIEVETFGVEYPKPVFLNRMY